MNYRFKTEKEFLAQYGFNWRSRVPLQWVSELVEGRSMDHLFGKDVRKTLSSDCLVQIAKNGVRKDVSYQTSDRIWNISGDMLTKGSERISLINKDR